MEKIITLFAAAALALACNQNPQPIPNDAKEEAQESEKAAEATTDTINFEERAEALKQQGHQVFLHEFEGQKYLMQEYYIVFLKAGDNREQDSLESAELMQQHLAHLTRMAEEGHSSLTGPMGDDGEIRGIVVYNTPTLKMADSLARLDPMVQSGRLKVEVHPWWTEKGGQLR